MVLTLLPYITTSTGSFHTGHGGGQKLRQATGTSALRGWPAWHRVWYMSVTSPISLALHWALLCTATQAPWRTKPQQARGNAGVPSLRQEIGTRLTSSCCQCGS